jgi:hypothetical protein
MCVVTRLTGHGLMHEGAAYDDDGNMIWTGRVNTAGPGRGKCECGALSDPLPSGNARKSWHRDVHKPQVAQEMEAR